MPTIEPSPTFLPAEPTLTAAPATTAAPGPTATAGFSPAFQELRATLELFSREKLEEGASAVLVKARVGQQEWELASGVRSQDTGDPVQPSDLFPVGEQYRSFLAVSVMKLVDEGRLGLADRVAAYLPGSLAADSPVTIRELLGDAIEVPDAGDLSEGALTGADATGLLGQVVERLRGAPLEAVLQTEVLTPLNLRSTQLLEANAAVPETLIHGYVQLEGQNVDVTGAPLPDGISSGGLVSTLKDVSEFHAALLRGRLLSPSGLVAMKGTVFADDGFGLDHWDDRCTNGLYYGYTGDIPGYGSVSITSADGNRQLSIFMAYPPQPVTSRPSALALEMTGVAQVALNSGCRFQFR
ncbi:serine hydrolase domain-containing protein [Paenarthrobacter aurescens]|uniref:serine hydrolase domain-containing protein n=1 Tax=Paenarthrobacter aurescens TaxID=43663 RepID=UPI001FE9C588|nr:serine hydrolase domain-containing protein [Paenarthrobacter aurescens]MDO6143486.1 beta-lactamase family protein [Paenarthrobacter aurescens]MDO6147334.1 beta-lactamase family protein [Paenarthrobacter aurescens]MDO6158578.1 beta-lactamase family protein [Paenarthrobacter aurescens]MDO6162561.1 beta-lactamase family protein [Paenarthrobacter aurescens]